MKCNKCQTELDNRGDCAWGCSQDTQGNLESDVCISEIQWEYEDQLPALSDAEFTKLFIASRTIDGVRMYPFTQDHTGHRTWISTPYQP